MKSSVHTIGTFVSLLAFLSVGLCAAESKDLGKVSFSIKDEATGQIIPARVHLKNAVACNASKKYPIPDMDKVVRVDGYPSHIDHFTCLGTFELQLPPGNYTYEIEHGQQYSMATGSFAVEKDQELTRTVTLKSLIDITREGWWSGDVHLHRPVKDMELLMKAEDVHVAPDITWWNGQNDWRSKAPPANPVLQFDGNRFCDVMVGEDERYGGALLYFNLKRPLEIGGEREHPSMMKPLNEARTFTDVHVDVEKPFWWDVPLWIASGKIDTVSICYNQMCRTWTYPGEGLGRKRDEARFPGPQGNGFYGQQIYSHLQNTGHRVPPSAGSASGVLPNPLGYNRVWVQVGPTLSYEAWWKGLRAGRSFVSNGPLLRCRANDEWPGHVFRAEAGKALRIDIKADLFSREKMSRIEIIRNGEVLQTITPEQWTNGGSLGQIEFKESGWFLVRAFADNPQIFRFASTAPWYVEIGDRKNRISKASVQYFIDWEDERIDRLKKWFQTRKIDDATASEVLKYHMDAKAYWAERLKMANAE